jgi:hypothetical protein
MAKHVSIDTREIDRLSKDLKNFTKAAFPIATQRFLNNSAADAMRQARSIIKVDMILKNKFTERSILFNPTRKTLKINQMFSAMGSTQEYMADQQFGAVKFKTGKHGVAIPTSEAAGQGRSKPRTKAVISRNKLQNLILQNRNIRVGKSKRKPAHEKQRNLLIVKRAIKTGKRYAYMVLGDSGQTEGIFKIIGGMKTTKRGWPEGARLKMIYDLSRPSVVIPKNDWIEEAVDGTKVKMPRMFIKELQNQARRHSLFKTSFK